MKVAVTSIVDLERTAHNRLHQLLNVVSRHHEVTVFSIQDWWKEGQVGDTVYRSGFEEVLSRLTIVPLTPKRISPIAQEVLGGFQAGRLLRQAGQFDVHFDYNTLLSGDAFGARLAKAGVPTVYDLADDLVAMVGNSPQIPRLLRPVGVGAARRALRRNLDRASRVTVINEVLAHDAGVAADKLRVLPNGVDTEKFSPGRGQVRGRLGLEGALVLGYVGVLREWVDFRPVLGALADLRGEDLGRPLRLVIVGEEGGRARIEQQARELGVADQLVFAGTVPYREVPEYIGAMDAGLIPFDAGKISANSLPLKLFEYAACGKPVVSTPLPGVKECAGERVRYAATRAEMAAVIRTLAAGEDASRVKSNLEWVRAGYSWASVGDRLNAILAEAAAE